MSRLPIAVVGVSALFPDSPGRGAFWRNIVGGTDLIGEVPASHWLVDDYYDAEPGEADKTYCKRGGFLPWIDFDPMEFGIPPKTVPSTDTTQLLALIAARQVLTDAYGAQFGDVDKSRMSVVLGVTAGQELLIQAAARLQRPQWLAALREEGLAEEQAQRICDRIAEKYTPWQECTFPGLLGNVVAGRIANRFDLGGTNCVTDAACASSLSALSMALSELYLGHSDVVITGGVDCFNDIFMYMCFSKTPALSKTGDCRPFADGADGTLMGEGLGMFALKRLDDAEEAGDQIYGVIRGIGSSSDGRSLSVYAPLPEGQAQAIRRAHERSGVTASSVELVEAHGTGTKAGDVAEFEGLRQAFGSDGDEVGEPWCALGSIKSQVGHTKAAAGAAGMFKAVMALHHRTLPPTIKVGAPNPKLPIGDSPFYLNTEARPWIRGDDHPRRAGVSSFGFGGSNFHVILEEYEGPGARPGRLRALPTELFLWSADEADELRATLKGLADDLRAVPDDSGERRDLLSVLAYQSQTAFEADEAHRFCCVAGSLDELRGLLTSAANHLNDAPGEEFELPRGALYRHQTRADGKVAMLFPGQGSQYVGMGADLAMHFDVAREIWDDAASQGLKLHHRVFPPPAFDDETRQAQTDALTATDVAQPAIGAESAARLALLRALGVDADFVGGHSFGEVTALYAAEVWDRATMLDVAQRRGELMAAAAEETSGAMTAVRLDALSLTDLLGDRDIDVVVANDNSPGQVVISGTEEAIEAAESLLDEELIAFQRLPVATAFHSPVVAGATEPFAAFLGDLSVGAPKIPVFANATADAYDDEPEKIRTTLTSQIEKPVRFVEMVNALYDEGARVFLEVGPHNVLTGLVSRCLRDEPVHAVSTDRRGKDGVTAFLEGLAELASLGIDLDFNALWAGYELPEDPRLKEKSKFTLRLNGANYDRPYPPAGGADDVPPPNPERPSTAGVDSTKNLNYTTTNTETHNGSITEEPTMSDQDYPHQAPQALAPTARPGSAQAFAEYQRSLAQSHMAYLRVMEQSVTRAQMAYMQAMEASFRQWCSGDGGQAGAVDFGAFEMPQPVQQQAPQAYQPPAPQAYPPPAPQAYPPPAPQAAAPQQAPQPAYANGAAPRYANGHAPQPAPAPQAAAPAPAPQSAAPAAPAPTPEAAPTNGGLDLPSVFMDVVADKTGYPVDMLDDSMALEADLGIDSIKRVEILSAVQEQIPTLPELNPNDMATLKTVGEIIGYLQDSGGGASLGK